MTGSMYRDDIFVQVLSFKTSWQTATRQNLTVHVRRTKRLAADGTVPD